jgi:hypothetical protein
MPESLETRKRKLAGLRDRDGNPIDERKLTHSRFLSSPNIGSAAILSKSKMVESDRGAYREELAAACEGMAKLMAQLRPSMSKASLQKASRNREAELLEAARKLRRRR